MSVPLRYLVIFICSPIMNIIMPFFFIFQFIRWAKKIITNVYNQIEMFRMSELLNKSKGE